MGEKERDKRAYPRIFVEGKVKGQVKGLCEGLLLDISVGGALIEHVQALRPGIVSFLELELEGKRVKLRCRVARSVARRTEVQPDGEREMVYHSGLEFLDIPQEMGQVISDYIQSMTGEKNAGRESEPDERASLLAELEEMERLMKEATKKFAEEMARREGTP